ncbi:hypothetical protein P344_01015 [Spiroplasma mirum ATCC 29335]|uniref:Uncharacterized protein n=1 Tax=Spiroplasma mirum ATCC 29335 TaxID=838561 RepID=W6AKK5_9MOLU|nr:hypothetical protein P344_01015 [Spiroplasma mirum ATCC 29335]AKM52773.1 hypothetical protein SATRI_v1c02070 [Spiroplasma atrichopogonis]
MREALKGSSLTEEEILKKFKKFKKILIVHQIWLMALGFVPNHLVKMVN